ncbi:MAG: NAD(P)-dependent dehydrogenase (short-subunit alcohol dehydrogenase family) [Psychrobacter glaciei]
MITGGASGIGRSLALNLTKRGAIVALADKSMTGLEETQKMVVELGGTASIHELDVSDHVAFSALADEHYRDSHVNKSVPTSKPSPHRLGFLCP